MNRMIRLRPLGRGVLAVVLTLSLIAVPAFAQENEYEQGKLQGEADARGQAVWILSGLLLGPIGLILPWVINPRVPGASLIGKSAEFVTGYMEGYRHEAKPKNFLYSLIGFAVWAVAATVIIVGVARETHETATSCGDAFSDSCNNSCSGVFDKWLNENCTPSCSPQLTRR